ncbi:MAG: ABC transporter substrate-binding protein, partial [Bacteroidota bacterium]
MTYIFALMRPAGILLCCIIMLIGCTDQDISSDLHVLHYNQHNNITSLDPAYAKSQNNIWAVNHIYSTLLDLDDSLRIVPGLAHTWESSEDGRRHTFYLRSDVLYQDDPCFKDDSDRTLTAEDVKYSYERLMDTTLNAPGSWVFAGKVADERPFEVVNDTTLVIRLSRPFAPFLSLLTMQYCSIVPKEAVEYYGGDFFKQPVGSGPFQFKRWISNQGLFLTRYEDYHGWKDSTYASNLDGVRTSFIGERSLAFLELVNGQIDFFTGLESSYINTALTPTGDLRERYADRIQFVKMPYLNFEYLGMNPGAPGAHPLLAETDFRKALNYGID